MFQKYNQDGSFTNVYTAKELAKIVRDTVGHYQQSAAEAASRAAKTREEVAADIVNEYAGENQRLKATLSRCVFLLGSQKEMEAFCSFTRRHEACRKNSILLFPFPFVSQAGTSVGVNTIVVCPVCGKMEEITDVSAW